MVQAERQRERSGGVSDLAAFTEARLAEAKSAADALKFACRLPDKEPDFTACGGPAAEAYWRYFNPDFMLDAIDGLRKLAGLHGINSEPEKRLDGKLTGHTVYWCWTCEHDRDYQYIPDRTEGCETHRHVAAIFRHHPDYRQEWAPRDL
jgi:hypothetical protein